VRVFLAEGKTKSAALDRVLPEYLTAAVGRLDQDHLADQSLLCAVFSRNLATQ
jgi:hypothetical protein